MDLTQFRVGVPDIEDSPLEPLPVYDPVFRGHILAFDQSLANTGYAVLTCFGPGQAVHFNATGMLRSGDDLKGHEKTLTRASELFEEVRDLLQTYQPNGVVFETPPTSAGPGRMNRPESSLLAAQSIRIASGLAHKPVTMLARQKVYKRFTGAANADKKALKEALTKLLEFHGIVRPERQPWNEHTIDATGIALLYSEGSTRW